MVNFLVGYIIVVNLISLFVLSFFKMQESQKDIPDKTIDTTFIVLSILGGFVGIAVGSNLFGYRTDTKVIKRWIPLIIAAYVIVIAIILFNTFDGQSKVDAFIKANSKALK